MNDIKINTKTKIINVTVPFEVHTLKGKSYVDIFVDEDLSFEIECLDWFDVTYMDEKITNEELSKIIKFHREINIDLQLMVTEEIIINKLTPDVVKYLISCQI